MAGCLLGIDYGTGGTKAVLIDYEGRELANAYEEYEFVHERPGWSEHDAENYWQAACRMIRSCLDDAGVSGEDVKAVAVSSALPSMVMVNRDHNPVNRGYNLLDRRATDQVAWLKENIGEERIFATSGYRIEDHPNLVNLLWEKKHRPESFAKIWKVLTIDGFITLKLTGTASAHYSGAAFYGVAYDLRKRAFDPDIMTDIDIDPDLMPDLYDCDDVVGEITSRAAEQTGLSAGTPVAAGQVDCNASWVGAGAVDVGDFQCNLGTVGNFGIIYKDVDFVFSDIGRLLMNFPYTVKSSETYVTVPTTLTGGQTLRYLRDNFSQAEQQAERLLGISSYDLLTLEAGKIEPGCNGLIALPFLMGERTPIWDSNARGTIFGLSLSHGKGHLVRAMMEGVAYAMYDNFRLVQEAGLKVNYPMVLNEGGAVSRLWRSIITDVFGIPTAMVKRRSGAPFGDAVLAGVATGVYKDFSVTKEWAEYIDPMEPDSDNHSRYQDYFGLYKELYEQLKGSFEHLAKLRAKYE